MIDLQKYCSDDLLRPYLHHPFTDGEWTYATNGHICIRVPRLPDARKCDFKHSIQKLFLGAVDRTLTPIRKIELEKPFEIGELCGVCSGTGKDPEDDRLECPACDGRGIASVTAAYAIHVAGRYLSPKYAAMLGELDGLQFTVADSDREMDPLRFSFNRGNGVVMGMRWDVTRRSIEWAAA